MIGWCKLAGAVLMVSAGVGAGWCRWRQKYESWQQMRRFTQLLGYLLDAIRYRALPGAVLLAMAADRPEFAMFGLGTCRTFSDIPVPAGLGQALGPDWSAALADLESAPQQTACRSLAYLIAQCRAAEQEAAHAAAQARRLCLPLGGSVGLLAVILLG